MLFFISGLILIRKRTILNKFKNFFMPSLLMFFVAWVAGSKELQMIAPEIPPHFDVQGRGRIGDVISAVLTRCGHQVKFTVVPFGRHWHDYKEKKNTMDWPLRKLIKYFQDTRRNRSSICRMGQLY